MTDTAATPPGRRPVTSPSPRPVRTALLAVVALVGATVIGELSSRAANIGDADGATVVLQGQAMAHGNLLLAGWQLSYDGFWSLDAPFYAVATAALGIRPLLLYLVPSLVVALCVVVGAAAAGERRRPGGAVVGAAVVVAALCLPAHTTAYFLLRGPLHIATALFALAAFVLLRRGRFGLSWLVAVVLVAAGLLGDLQMLGLGTGPMVVGGTVAMLRERRLRPGLPPIAAAAVSGALAWVVRQLTVALGGYRTYAANRAPTAEQVHRNLHHLPQFVERVVGVSAAVYGRGGDPSWLGRAHIVVAAVLALGVLAALVRLLVGVVAGGPPPGAHPKGRLTAAVTSEPWAWRLDDMLVAACVGTLVAFVFLAQTDDPTFARYLTALLIFASVIAGRVCARWWDGSARRAVRSFAGALGAVAVGLLALGVGFTLTATPAAEPDVALSAWLVRHHLTSGLADYFSASLTTVTSGDRVRVRPVVAEGGRIVSYNKGPLTHWYAGRTFRFLVFTPFAIGGVDRAAAVTTWGRPAATADVAGYRILVWDHSLTVPIRTR